MRRVPSRRGCIVAAIAVALLTASCGGGGTTATDAVASDTTAAASSTETPTSTATTASATSSSSSPSPSKKKKNVVAWVLGLGPGAPSGPPEFTAYRELQQRHCSTVFDRVKELTQPAQRLYTGAAQACLAALGGRADLWSKAKAALAAVSPQTGELTCMDRAAYALLDRLVSLHRDHPDRDFVKAPSGSSHAPPCPRIAALTPHSGSHEAPIRMTGSNLGAVTAIDVVDSLGDSNPAENVHSVGDRLWFTMPAPSGSASATVCVLVKAEPDWVADGALFTYEDESVGPAADLACPPHAEG
jgi:hypothetical protein